MNNTQNTAIVTGGCSGLGHATTKALIAANWHVIMLDMNAEAAQERIAEHGADSCSFLQVDVTSDAAVEEALSTAFAEHSNIRLCVNCAGVAPAKRILNRDGDAMPLGDFAKTININLIGTFNVSRVAASYFAKNEALGEAAERGLIINTASVAGYEGQIGQTAYAASKGGIIGLCLPMARDLAPLGIRVNTIAPGVMGTPMLLAMPENVQHALTANVQFPKRLGLPEEFAKLVLHMYDNKYLNGETVRLDGALRMPPK
ncbi:SDR family NAD(P)-dependent oxidoreductase [Glaciecola sp. XM2]|jgi:NAD(P)-dependent dehydrogenase (short-subunit alcohol dehydrogenase family)|uniref:SDR family NAD(P)-dependent oxidoreductase n=1 Tax=Glaciecola sp. XM2 TaxID=1914931 RepID=UPI001BDEBABF|nr:SDR family NAD(P)-dependent oxidoreductase [Glaciecola sp. XM2]MBT1452030.1 SDR family NAD(P)-dependent oxidoreductase [Glaciecola sp. XM2]